MSETNAPVKNARYKRIIVCGKPKISPNTEANLTSPKPIPLPFVKIKIKEKNKNVKNETIILLIKFPFKNKYISETIKRG